MENLTKRQCEPNDRCQFENEGFLDLRQGQEYCHSIKNRLFQAVNGPLSKFFLRFSSKIDGHHKTLIKKNLSLLQQQNSCSPKTNPDIQI